MSSVESNTAETLSWATMLNCDNHRRELDARVKSITALLDATHLSTQGTSTGLNISREARGLAILLLFASYEHLLVMLCQSVLEAALALRVANRRLRPGLKLIAAHASLQGLINSTETAIWTGKGLKLIEALDNRKACSIATTVFPRDGSFMKTSQIRVFCDVLGFGDPAPVLRELWPRIDTIVTERNKIAHGGATADEIGRAYSIADTRKLVALWQARWGDFLTWAETSAASRDFFRVR